MLLLVVVPAFVCLRSRLNVLLRVLLNASAHAAQASRRGFAGRVVFAAGSARQNDPARHSATEILSHRSDQTTTDDDVTVGREGQSQGYKSENGRPRVSTSLSTRILRRGTFTRSFCRSRNVLQCYCDERERSSSISTESQTIDDDT